MGALAKLSSYSDKILPVFSFKEVLRLAILGICILWKYYKLITANYKYMSTINKKSSKFTYRKKAKPVELAAEYYCSICLSVFEDGEEGRELVECKHVFHRHCLEKWLRGVYKATCPLCRSLVVPHIIVAEYRRMQIEQEDVSFTRGWLLSC